MERADILPALKFGFPADGIALFYRHGRFACSPAPTGVCACVWRGSHPLLVWQQEAVSAPHHQRGAALLT